jgi:sporulation protein YlmC with PRC-barrel domain
MKSNSILITAALMASCLCLQTQGAENPDALKYRRPEKFAELDGAEVLNMQNEKLGRVKFVTADLENGRLVEVVVTSGGGFLGFGARLTAVPPRALTFDEKGQLLRLNVSRAKFAAAPRFDRSHMAEATARERVAEVCRYYGLQPWFFLPGQTVVKNAEILPLGHIEKLKDMLGMPISSAQRGYLGQVGSLMTDLPKGRLVHVIAEGNSMGGNANVVIQARALKFNAAHSALVVDDNYKQLADEPHFKWLSSGAFMEESYVNREVQADKGVHSKQNAQAGKVSHVHAMEQGVDFRDRQKTAMINQAIQADPRLSSNAKQIEVVTLHSQTTLRGRVNSAEGRRRIGEIAARLGRPEDVSNQLVIQTLR